MAVARRLQSLNNRVFRRIARDEIQAGVARLGVVAGDTIFAHVSLRRLGYILGGPNEMVEAILDILGPSGTLVMSAWPAPDPGLADHSRVFDVAETPSACGLLSEALRKHPKAHRSLHPIASVVAVGAQAESLTAGHEETRTPFGPDSPYGKLARLTPRLLLVGAHIGGVAYHVQDRVGFPNLYRHDAVEFEVRDQRGRYRKLATAALRSEVPPVVILPGGRPEGRDYLLMPDYAFMFPSERERRVLEAGYLRHNRSRFLGRRDRLHARGMLTMGRIGGAEVALLDGARLIEQVAKDLAWDIARYKEEYDPEALSCFSLPVL